MKQSKSTAYERIYSRLLKHATEIIIKLLTQIPENLK